MLALIYQHQPDPSWDIGLYPILPNKTLGPLGLIGPTKIGRSRWWPKMWISPRKLEWLHPNKKWL